MRAREIEVYFDEAESEVMLFQGEENFIAIPQEQLALVIKWMKEARITDVR